jgi:hypothetical protein
MEVIVAPQNATASLGTESEEELFRIQLSVAKRADELARSGSDARCAEGDRQTWLLAEAELLPAFVATPAG